MTDAKPTVEQQLADLRHVAPTLTATLEKQILDELWSRPGLALRDRAIVTFSAVVALARTWELKVYAGKALDAGITPVEIDEMLQQLGVYCGWPAAVGAALELRALYDARGIGAVVNQPSERLDLPAAAEAKRKATVAETVAPTAPMLAHDTDELLFGEVWRRPGLSARDRSLTTMAALIAIGQPEQLTFHANRAMDNGLSEAEAGEALSHLAYYVGWPRAMSAVGMIAKIIAGRRSGES
jgi:4-carboxymuconolactone decarboxylase